MAQFASLASTDEWDIKDLTAPFFCFEDIMAKDYAKQFYKSTAWKECRMAYIKSVGGLCEECLKHGIYTPGKIVHHKIPLTEENINDPSITLSWDNFKLVCQDCHAKEHAAECRYSFDEFGGVVPPIKKKG